MNIKLNIMLKKPKMGTLYETNSSGVGHNTTKASQKLPKNLQT
jgi:hypothetical protein